MKDGIQTRMPSAEAPAFLVTTGVPTIASYNSSFRGTSGVKQGCSMSPILSNIYQNDLHSIFTHGCDPVQLGETSINSISWADDLLLLSTSKRGLQNCLNDLKSYCYKWGLQVNSSKTKCMILTKQTYRSDKFEFHNTNLECVRSFNYLGFQISYNGKFRRIIDDRVSKAGKTGNMVDKRLRPILMYLWSYHCHYMINRFVLYCYMGVQCGHCPTIRIWYT